MKYARHKNSKRVYVMLALVWVVSISISSPIALGMNYTERRLNNPEICTFYNPDFIIYSSMGSFYIPCVIMILLYWRIFQTIRLRSKKKRAMQKLKKYPRPLVDNTKTPKLNVIENKAQTNRTTSDASATEDNSQKELLPVRNAVAAVKKQDMIAEETSFTNFNATMATTDTTGEDEHNETLKRIEHVDEGAHVIPNDKSTDFMLSPASDDSHTEYTREGGNTGNGSGYSAPTTVVVELKPGTDGLTETTLPPTSPQSLLPPPTSRHTAFSLRHLPKPKAKHLRAAAGGSPDKSVTKFNFHLRHSKKKKERLANKREKKATKTLAIVLGKFTFLYKPNMKV